MSYVLTNAPFPEHVQIDANIVYQETPELYVVMNMETKNLEYISKPITYITYNYMLKLGVIYYREIAKSSQMELSEIIQNYEMEKNELIQENIRLTNTLNRLHKNNRNLMNKNYEMKKKYVFSNDEKIDLTSFLEFEKKYNSSGCVILPYHWKDYMDDTLIFGSQDE
jgi:hypothetical protein